MKLKHLIAALAVAMGGLVSVIAGPAAARDHAAAWNPFVHGSSVGSPSRRATRTASRTQRYATRTRANRARSKVEKTYSGRYAAGPRPSRWCGWWMRTQRGGGPHLNVAWNWSKWGRPLSGPRVGAVVVWRHHVGEIVGRADNGKWIVRSGNDGGRVRTRARSVSGAVFRAG